MTTQTIINGNSAEVLKGYPDNHFDAVVTDPPYGIEFLGKDWDSNTGAIEVWQECLRVLKPGGHLLAFSAARTYHRLATNLEDVGFEIRDQLMWIYSSGFPKAQDIGKAIDKMNGKPSMGKYCQTRGGINYDGGGNAVEGRWRCNKCEQWFPDAKNCGKPECPVPHKTREPDENFEPIGQYFKHKESGKMYRRLPDNNGARPAKSAEGQAYGSVYEEVWTTDNEWAGWKTCLKPAHEPIVVCRKPFKGSATENVLEHGVGAFNIDACRIDATGDKPQSVKFRAIAPIEGSARGNLDNKSNVWVGTHPDRYPSNVIGEFPEDIQKYFYCPKVSRKERHVGLDATKGIFIGDTIGFGDDGKLVARAAQDNVTALNGTTEANVHPTVKPVALMAYLIKLVVRKGGIVLDPFNGSGSTGMAAKQEGMDYVGIDLDPSYCEVSRKRIAAWANNATLDEFF